MLKHRGTCSPILHQEYSPVSQSLLYSFKESADKVLAGFSLQTCLFTKSLCGHLLSSTISQFVAHCRRKFVFSAFNNQYILIDTLSWSLSAIPSRSLAAIRTNTAWMKRLTLQGSFPNPIPNTPPSISYAFCDTLLCPPGIRSEFVGLQEV